MTTVFAGMPNTVWVWLIFAVIMILIEMMTMGLTTIWGAGGALAAMFTALLTDSLLAQCFVFAVVTLLLVVITRPLAVKKLNNRTVRTNIDALIGKEAVAESDIDDLNRGEVRTEGKVWTAVPAEGSPAIQRGDIVRIVAIEGVKLIVVKEV